MNKVVLSLLVIALAVVAAIALYFSSFSAPLDSQATQLPAPTAAAPPTAIPKPDEVLAPTAPGDLKGVDATAASQREARARDLIAVLPPEKICILSVHMALPGGTPRDDETEIFVFGNILGETNIDGDLALLKPGDPLPKWLIARVPFDPNGVTEITLEKRNTPVGVGLRGRYCYAEPLLSVDISQDRGEATLHTLLGACVHGRLIPPAGASEAEREFKGAKLHLNSDPMKSIGLQTNQDVSKIVSRDSVALEDGSFEIRGVNPAKNLLLTGRPEHLAAFKSTIDELTAGKLFETSITLTRGATVTGRVLDEAGAAVASAKLEVTVDAVMWGFGGRSVREGKSGADGSFTLEAVSAGKSLVNVSKDGFLDSTQELDLAEGGRMNDLVLHLSGGARIAGHVRWKDGTNSVDAKVAVTFDQAGLTGMGAMNARFGAKGDGRTDDQGRFSVSGLGKGPFTIQASATPAGADKDDDSALWTAQVDAIKPGAIDVELTLEPTGAVAGHVVDDVGAPVAACTVVVAAKPRNPFIPSSDRHEVQVKDAAGHFSIKGLKAGAYTALARDASGVESPAVALQLPLETGPGDMELTLPRPATVSGRVLLPDGTPAANASVHQQVNVMAAARGGSPGGGPGVNTDGQGVFKIQSLPMGALLLQASKDGYAPSEGVPLTLTPAAQVTDITITMRVGGTITGEVFGDHGAPKAGARILAQIPDLSFGQLWSQSDSAGKFELQHVAPGQWQVMSFEDGPSAGGSGNGSSAGDDSAAAADFMKHLKLAMAAVKDGETVHVVLGAPPKDPVHVRARVTSAKTPVSGAIVSFLPSGGSKEGGALASLKMSPTDKDGRFEIDLDHSGSYLVSVQKMTGAAGQQSIEFSRDIPEVPDYLLELELPLGSISGRVANLAGNAVVGARVSLNVDGPIRAGTITGGRFSELQTDDQGEFMLEWLKPGRYTVSAGGALFPGLTSDKDPLARQVHDGIEIEEGQRVSGIDFRLHTACELKGKVLDAGGKPVNEASIFVRDEAGRPVDRLVLTSTDAGGNFVQRGLGAGRYTVTARSSDLVSSEEANVVLREGEPTEVEVHVSGGTILIVTLNDPSGATIDGSFSVIDEKGHQVNGLYSMVDLMKVMSDGAFDAKHQRIGPLPHGKYTITASNSDGTKATKSVTLVGMAERKVTLTIGS